MNAIRLPSSGTPVADVPDPVGLLRSVGVLMSEQDERLDAIARAQYVLVRIDDIGERWRCRRCGCKHAHFTLFCQPRPFKGLAHGLLAYWQNTAAPDRDLSPLQRQRRAEVGRAMGFEALPQLADRHPQTARQIATPTGSLDLGAWVLGTIDPIAPQKARLLASLINARAGRPLIRL